MRSWHKIRVYSRLEIQVGLSGRIGASDGSDMSSYWSVEGACGVRADIGCIFGSIEEDVALRSAWTQRQVRSNTA